MVGRTRGDQGGACSGNLLGGGLEAGEGGGGGLASLVRDGCAWAGLALKTELWLDGSPGRLGKKGVRVEAWEAGWEGPVLPSPVR